MSLLLSGTTKIQFDALEAISPQDLPIELREAAAIIQAWQSGQEFFEMQTSGSTGISKKIILHRPLLEYSARLTADSFGIKENDNLFCCLSLKSIAGFMMVIRALVNNANLVMALPESYPLENMPVRFDFAAFVPLQMKAILEKGYEALKILNRMKAILLGGAPLPGEMEKEIQKIQSPVFQTYSMTETYTHIAARRLNGAFRSERYRPLKDVTVSLDERHCLVIQSPITHNNPLVTNDRAEIFPDGTFRWQGRYDNSINSGGIKIQLEQAEAQVQEILKVEKIENPFFLTALADEKLGQRLVLIIQGRINTDWLQWLLKKEMPPYHAPRAIYLAHEILKTESGKIDKIATLQKLRLL